MSDSKDFVIKKGVLSKYKGKDPDVIVPEGVTVIGELAFQRCKTIKTVIIPEGVTTIEFAAFSECPHLESVELPKSLERIEHVVFNQCYSLENITLPTGITNIEADTFDDCHNLTKIVIPDGVKKIGKQAFYGCSELTEIVIPDSVTEIEDGAFGKCLRLKSVTIPHTVKKIGKSAFENCYELSFLDISPKLQKIGSRAFKECSELADENGFVIVNGLLFDYLGRDRELEIPEGVEVIKEDSLLSSFHIVCPFQKITLPNSLKNIEYETFSCFCDLPECNLPEGFLQQTEKLDAKMIPELLRMDSWQKSVTEKDYAALWVFQTAKGILKEIEPKVIDAPDHMLKLMCELLKEKGKASHYKKVVDFYLTYQEKISQDTVNELYATVANANVQTAVEALAPYVTLDNI